MTAPSSRNRRYTRSFQGSPSASSVPPKSNSIARSFAVNAARVCRDWVDAVAAYSCRRPGFPNVRISPILYHRLSACKSLRTQANCGDQPDPPARSRLPLGEDLEGRELVEAVGIEPTSGNPQPQASTSIADLLYCFSPRGTPIGRITARPASKVSPLP